MITLKGKAMSGISWPGFWTSRTIIQTYLIRELPERLPPVPITLC